MKSTSATRSAPSIHRYLSLVTILAVVACGKPPFGLTSAKPQEEGWAAALIGSWALVDSANDRLLNATAAPRDTSVWDITAGGRLRYAEVRVRTRQDRLVADEREIQTAWWWLKSHTVDGAIEHILCTSTRPGRGRQCGRVSVDTATISGTRPVKRLTWSGLTFKSQHWAFVERAPRP